MTEKEDTGNIGRFAKYKEVLDHHSVFDRPGEESYFKTLRSVTDEWTPEEMKSTAKYILTDKNIKEVVVRIFSVFPKEIGDFEKLLVATITTSDKLPAILPNDTKEAVAKKTKDKTEQEANDEERLYLTYGLLVLHDIESGRGNDDRMGFLNALSAPQKTMLNRYVKARLSIPDVKSKLEVLLNMHKGQFHPMENEWMKEANLSRTTYASDRTMVLGWGGPFGLKDEDGNPKVTAKVPRSLIKLSHYIQNLLEAMDIDEEHKDLIPMITEADTREDFDEVIRVFNILIPMFSGGFPWRTAEEFDSMSTEKFNEMFARFDLSARPHRFRTMFIMKKVLARFEIVKDVFEKDSLTTTLDLTTGSELVVKTTAFGKNIGFNASQIFVRGLTVALLELVSSKGTEEVARTLADSLTVPHNPNKVKYSTAEKLANRFIDAFKSGHTFFGSRIDDANEKPKDTDKMEISDANNNNDIEEELGSRFKRLLATRQAREDDKFSRRATGRDDEGNKTTTDNTGRRK